MSVNTEGTRYEERLSKDGRYQYTICYVDGWWDVDCWKDLAGGIGQFNDNHWNRRFRNEAEAQAEFLRFD